MKNALGMELSPAQAELIECYDKLASLLSGELADELAPYERRNALKALGALWQVQNGLDMDRGQLYHVGA
jgi:hypothetical protein